MGSILAAGFAEGVTSGIATLESAIYANLRSNHYPPLPGDYVAPIVAAIQAVQDDDPDALIFLPVTLNPLPRSIEEVEDDDTIVSVRARDLLTITHSWDFVDPGEDFEDFED